MLSLVLTNYNHERYLPIALEGLANQSRPAGQTIFIDDASTDNSVAIFERYLPRFADATLIRNARNAGVVANLNRGLELATGEFVYFAAADDLVYENLFKTAIDLLEAHPRAALFSSRSDTMDAAGRNNGALATAIPIMKPGYISPEQAARQMLEDDGWFMGNATIYRRQPLADIGGFPPALNAFTDGFVSRLLALKQGACFSPEVLCSWRRMDASVSSAQTLNLAKTMHVIELVEQRMAAEADVFPPGYAERWRGRHLFASRRYALVQQRRLSRTEGSLPYLRALAREWVATPWLFMKLRRKDLVSVTYRRLRQLAHGG